MAYKDVNHPKVQLFRLFRDNTLMNYRIGRGFISFYYKYSKSWVAILKDKMIINFLIKKVLDSLAFCICKLYKTDFKSICCSKKDDF